MQPDEEAPLIEETPQDFANQPEEPFERKLHERADVEPEIDEPNGDEEDRDNPAPR